MQGIQQLGSQLLSCGIYNLPIVDCGDPIATPYTRNRSLPSVTPQPSSNPDRDASARGTWILWLSHGFAMVKPMSYVTLEAAIRHGRIVVKEPEKLPDSARALLTILPSDTPQDAASTPLDALEALQRHLSPGNRCHTRCDTFQSHREALPLAGRLHDCSGRHPARRPIGHSEPLRFSRAPNLRTEPRVTQCGSPLPLSWHAMASQRSVALLASTPLRVRGFVVDNLSARAWSRRSKRRRCRRTPGHAHCSEGAVNVATRAAIPSLRSASGAKRAALLHKSVICRMLVLLKKWEGSTFSTACGMLGLVPGA